MLNRVIIGLGSNLDKEKNMAAAVRLLEDCFVSIRFSAAVYTEPVGMNNPALFLNRVAVAFTSEEPDRLVAALKQKERMLGRTTNGKSEGIIPIDIDLLQWNDLILKPEDLQREYVKAGIRFLQEVESGGHEKYKPNK